jgi:hypothetical protein
MLTETGVSVDENPRVKSLGAKAAAALFGRAGAAGVKVAVPNRPEHSPSTGTRRHFHFGSGEKSYVIIADGGRNAPQVSTLH